MSPNLVQRLSSEALGTLIPVYFGVAATLAATGGSLGVAAAYAVALALAVWIFAAVSGAHVNPAVTIALAIRGRFAWADAPGYVIA
jgi:glycerol uptake facilitator protein